MRRSISLLLILVGPLLSVVGDASESGSFQNSKSNCDSILSVASWLHPLHRLSPNQAINWPKASYHRLEKLSINNESFASFAKYIVGRANEIPQLRMLHFRVSKIPEIQLAKIKDDPKALISLDETLREYLRSKREASHSMAARIMMVVSYLPFEAAVPKKLSQHFNKILMLGTLDGYGEHVQERIRIRLESILDQWREDLSKPDVSFAEYFATEGSDLLRVYAIDEIRNSWDLWLWGEDDFPIIDPESLLQN